MSEYPPHKHEVYGDSDYQRVCKICGIDAGDLVDELQEQLADAQAKITRQEEELRIVAAQRQDYKAQAAEARALLEEIAKWEATPYKVDDDGIIQTWLLGVAPFHAMQHAIRAFLQKLKG